MLLWCIEVFLPLENLEEFNMKTVVTGGAGFIGSHLVKRLLEEKREVVIADDFSRGSRQNLLDLRVGIECERIDLRDYEQASEFIKGADVVFHLAARVGSLEYLHGSEMCELAALQTNLAIDVNVFRACLEHGVRRIIYASSVSVYPIAPQQCLGAVLSEDDLSRFDPEGGYGWAKLLGEMQLSWMKELDISIARVFNVYGENEDLGENAHVIPALIRKAILYPQEDFIVWGNGRQTRDLLYVSDCVDAVLKLEEKAQNPPLVVNIGSAEAVPIRSVAEKIVEVSGKGMKIEYDTTRLVGPMSRTAKMERAKELLDWEPKVSLDAGLRRTWNWARERLCRS
ncbi:NAD-dependent epimerase/dehydratase family protein [Chloroflexota bacterium]